MQYWLFQCEELSTLCWKQFVLATLCGCWILMPLHERDLMRLSDLIQGKFDFAFLSWSVWFSCLCYFHGLGRKQFSVVSLLWSFLSDILRNIARFAYILFNTGLTHICYSPNPKTLFSYLAAAFYKKQNGIQYISLEEFRSEMIIFHLQKLHAICLNHLESQAIWPSSLQQSAPLPPQPKSAFLPVKV